MAYLTLSELGDTRHLKRLLKAGETIELRDDEHIVAYITPEAKLDRGQTIGNSTAGLPDFRLRRQKLFGDHVFSAVEDFLEYRHGRY